MLISNISIVWALIIIQSLRKKVLSNGIFYITVYNLYQFWSYLVANSTPIVLLLSKLNSFLVKRDNRLLFPTPESPIKTTAINKWIIWTPAINKNSYTNKKQEILFSFKKKTFHSCKLQKNLCQNMLQLATTQSYIPIPSISFFTYPLPHSFSFIISPHYLVLIFHLLFLHGILVN